MVALTFLMLSLTECNSRKSESDDKLTGDQELPMMSAIRSVNSEMKLQMSPTKEKD